MPIHPPPVRIEVPDPPTQLYAGEWAPLTLVLTRPADHSGRAIVRQLRANNPDIQLDLDLFERDVELDSGESYRAEIRLRAARPGLLPTGDIEVEVNGELYPVLSESLPVRPSLRQELAVAVEPVCSYLQGTRVQVSLTHDGRTNFDDFRLRLEPADAIRSGKTEVRKARFAPDGSTSREQPLDAVVAPGRLTVRITAQANGEASEAAWEFDVPKDIPRPPERRFQFLEPRGLSLDDIHVHALDEEGEPELRPAEGVYWLRGKQRYRIAISPSHPDACGVTLRDLPEQVHVNANPTHQARRWEFEVFVPSNELFTSPGRLFYDVQTPDRTLSGEIHLAIYPPWAKPWMAALALGAAMTVQSVTLALNTLLGAEQDWPELLSHFNPLHGRQFWGLISIPLAWCVLKAADWLQYHWRT